MQFKSMTVLNAVLYYTSLGYQTLYKREEGFGHTAILRLYFWNAVASTLITSSTAVQVAANQNNNIAFEFVAGILTIAHAIMRRYSTTINIALFHPRGGDVTTRHCLG